MSEEITINLKKNKSKIMVDVSIPKRFYARDEKISFSARQAEEKAKSLLTDEEEVIILLSGPSHLCNWKLDLTSGVWIFEIQRPNTKKASNNGKSTKAKKVSDNIL